MRGNGKVRLGDKVNRWTGVAHDIVIDRLYLCTKCLQRINVLNPEKYSMRRKPTVVVECYGKRLLFPKDPLHPPDERVFHLYSSEEPCYGHIRTSEPRGRLGRWRSEKFVER